MSITTEGYKRTSPYKNSSKLKIRSPRISMRNVDFPVVGVSEQTGESKLMLPEQQYFFPNTKSVMEYKQKGGYIDLLKGYLPSIPENQQDELIDSLESVPEDERYDHLEEYMNGGCYKCGGKMKKGGKADYDDSRDAWVYGNGEVGPNGPAYKSGGWISKAVKHPGRCTPGSPNYDCPEGSPQWNLAQTFKKHHGFHQEGGQLPTYPNTRRQLSNSELEGEETVLTNTGNLFKVEGPSHADGGVHVNLQGGDRIFSEFLEAPKEVSQVVLGRKPNKKYSYADLSKKFPTKKQTDILRNPESDKYEKNGAEVQLGKNKAMLDTIFAAQESSKKEKINNYFQKGGAKFKDGKFDMTTQDWITYQPFQTSSSSVGNPGNPAFNLDYLFDYPKLHTEPSPTVTTGVVLPTGYNQNLSQEDYNLLTSKSPELELVIPDRTKPASSVKGSVSKKKPVVKVQPKQESSLTKFYPKINESDQPQMESTDEWASPRENAVMFPVTGSQFVEPEIQTTDDTQSYPGREKRKGKGEFGISPKLTGTLLDVALAMSDNLNVENPVLFNNQTQPLFNRFVQFDSKEPGRNLSLAVQQIQNSNLPENVKQSQIANMTAQYNDLQSKTDLANQQRYEGWQEGNINKLQGYLDRNQVVRNQDLENYLQRKGRVDQLKNQFKAQRKSRIVNAVRGYADYLDEVNSLNQIHGTTHKINPFTGRIKYTGVQQDPLKKQEELMSQFQQNSKNQISLPNGASFTPIGNGVGIVVSADGKADIVKM